MILCIELLSVLTLVFTAAPSFFVLFVFTHQFCNPLHHYPSESTLSHSFLVDAGVLSMPLFELQQLQSFVIQIILLRRGTTLYQLFLGPSAVFFIFK